MGKRERKREIEERRKRGRKTERDDIYAMDFITYL